MKSNRRKKESTRAEGAGLSRREFARGATVAAAAIAANPKGILGVAGALPAARETAFPPLPQGPSGEKLKLSAEALAEVEAKVAEIFRRYGAKLNEAQKADVRRLVREAQAPLEALRAYPLENSDEPATILHLVGSSSRSIGTPRRATGAPAASGVPGAAKKPAGGG